MEKINENIGRITTQKEYDLFLNHLESIIRTATQKGYLSELNADNEYTREIGRLSRLCARYENEFMVFDFKVKSPLLQSIQDEISKRGLRQKDAAELIGVKEPTFSRIMRGKRTISMRVAKRLYREFNIDPKLIVEYS